MSTKEKILDTAERLIAGQGFAGTSLRQIIAEAGVNLAAVHYHFGSKDDLLDHLIMRKATGVNEERLRLLAQLQNDDPSRPVPVEKLLGAFFGPMIRVGSQNPQFVKLMGRLYGEGLLPAVIEKHFQPTLAKFVHAMQMSLPALSTGELFWRMQFMFGAMSKAVCGWDVFPGIEEGEEHADFGLVMRRLMGFLCAGLQAPAVGDSVDAIMADFVAH
jgi:AcrR family transcriptional regulator